MKGKSKKLLTVITVILSAVFFFGCVGKPDGGDGNPNPNPTPNPPPDPVIPEMPGQMSINYDEAARSTTFSWEAVEGADGYEIERAGSRLGTYGFIERVSGFTYTDSSPNTDKYENYYKITAKRGQETVGAFTMSLEQKLFGENTLFYDIQYDSVASINEDIQRVYRIFSDPAEFGAGEFSSERYALYFKPGDYSAINPVNVGYYTHVAGLGRLPTDVKIRSVRTPPERPGNGSLCNFWRSIENLHVGAGTNTFNWAVSQAAPARRIYAEGSAVFDTNGGNASGGYVADSYFGAAAGSGPQQQYYTRNNYLTERINGVNWNNFLQGNAFRAGITQPSNWSGGGKDTNIETTPVIREKPFLFLDADGEYKVFAPALRRDAAGTSWSFDNPGAGTIIGIDKFYTAQAGRDTAATVNEALRIGKNIFFAPGIYGVEAPVQVNRANAIVLGTGMATLVPSDDNRYGALLADDVSGITVAGLMLDSGLNSVYLARIGDPGANNDHAQNPTVLSDLIFRNGGFRKPTNVDVALQINSNDVVVDHSWIWRADHGMTTLKLGVPIAGVTASSPAYTAVNLDRQKSVGWNMNTSKNGLLVSGDNVTAYGLFVEHFQEYQTLWLGENGRTYFYQCETPYDPTNQAAYMSRGTVQGYAAYKVGNDVKTHLAVGLGVYEVFNRTDPERGNTEVVNILNAVEVPHAPGVKIMHACTVGLGARRAQSDIKFIINGTGNSSGAAGMGPHRVVEFVNGTVNTSSSNKTAIAPADEAFNIFDGGRPVKITPAA